MEKRFISTRNGYAQEITDCICVGHWRQTEENELHSNFAWALEFQDGEHKDLAFISTMKARDPHPPNDEYYFFYCYDITHGPSSEIWLWKAQAKDAARVFCGFLAGHFDQRVSRQGREYYPSELPSRS